MNLRIRPIASTRRLARGRRALAFVVALGALAWTPWAAQGVVRLAAGAPIEQAAGLHRPLDEILDLYVRDGFVYYFALKQDRAKLDRYVAALDVPQARYEAWAEEDRIAYWVNAYNAFVLKTVVDHYPIRGRSPEYPPASIRQVAGAFERNTHRAGGRSLTLDEIETTVLPAFGDPRLFMALGRGAVDSGRLRSEAYEAARLQSQLDQVAEEFATRSRHVRIDSVQQRMEVSAIFGWREEQFVAVYADQAEPLFGSRSPIERAILAVVRPHLLPREVEMVGTNTFEIAYLPFDWRLNDLTGGRPD